MRLVIIGAGGYGQVIYEIAKDLNKYITDKENVQILFLDDRYIENTMYIYGTIEYFISGPCAIYEKYIDHETEFYPAIGNNEIRLEWGKKILEKGGRLATIIHPSAYVAKSAVIDYGTVILPNASVNSGCKIGKGCIINLGAIIDHGCIIEDGCHINSGAIVMAENRVPHGTKVDSGQVISFRQWPL